MSSPDNGDLSNLDESTAKHQEELEQAQTEAQELIGAELEDPDADIAEEEQIP